MKRSSNGCIETVVSPDTNRRYRLTQSEAVQISIPFYFFDSSRSCQSSSRLAQPVGDLVNMLPHRDP